MRVPRKPTVTRTGVGGVTKTIGVGGDLHRGREDQKRTKTGPGHPDEDESHTPTRKQIHREDLFPV